MEVVLGKRAPRPGLFQRRRRDGSRLPGWWFRHFKADGKRTMVFAGSSLKEAKAFARARLTEVEEVKALPPEKRIEHPIRRSIVSYCMNIDDGQGTVEGLDAGAYKVHANSFGKDFEPVKEIPIEVKAGKTTEVVVQLVRKK